MQYWVTLFSFIATVQRQFTEREYLLCNADQIYTWNENLGFPWQRQHSTRSFFRKQTGLKFK